MAPMQIFCTLRVFGKHSVSFLGKTLFKLNAGGDVQPILGTQTPLVEAAPLAASAPDAEITTEFAMLMKGQAIESEFGTEVEHEQQPLGPAAEEEAQNTPNEAEALAQETTELTSEARSTVDAKPEAPNDEDRPSGPAPETMVEILHSVALLASSRGALNPTTPTDDELSPQLSDRFVANPTREMAAPVQRSDVAKNLQLPIPSLAEQVAERSTALTPLQAYDALSPQEGGGPSRLMDHTPDLGHVAVATVTPIGTLKEAQTTDPLLVVRPVGLAHDALMRAASAPPSMEPTVTPHPVLTTPVSATTALVSQDIQNQTGSRNKSNWENMTKTAQTTVLERSERQSRSVRPLVTGSTLIDASSTSAASKHLATFLPELTDPLARSVPSLINDLPPVEGNLQSTVPKHVGAAPQAVVHSIAHQMGVALKAGQNGVTELVLNPSELGRVEMRLVTNDTGVTVQITVERPETQDLMRRHIDGLLSEFKQMGFRDVGFAFQDHSGRAHSEDIETGSPSSDGKEEETQPSPTTQHIVSLDDGLDIRL